VAGDDSGLTVLNVADPMLPATAREVLREVALHHADYFASAQQGGQFVLQKHVRIGPDGVFVADQKVAELGQVVNKIARNDVAEIKAQKKGRGIWDIWVSSEYFVGVTPSSTGFIFTSSVINGALPEFRVRLETRRALVIRGRR
jgi:hypothetical protein